MPRILVIDDEPVLRITFRHLLEREGHQVWVADNGRTGVEQCRAVHPDLVLTDIMMPEQDGFATIRIIHEEYPAMPIIAMSAVIGPAGRQQTLALGARCCITKPVQSEVLMGLIAELLQANGNGGPSRDKNAGPGAKPATPPEDGPR